MKRFWALGLPLVTALTLVGCIDESNVDVQLVDASVSEPQEAGVDEQPDTRVCSGLDSKQPIPARSVAIDGAPVSTQKTVYVDDLFNQLVAQCGGCHVDVGLGGFQTSRATFSQDVNQLWVDSMYLNNPDLVMPTPSVGGKIYKERAADDPVNAFADLLQKWIDQGRPRDVFMVPLDADASEGPFRLKPEVGKNLTNIGSCLPEKALYASDRQTMANLDAKFAIMTSSSTGTLAERIGLPKQLSQTDLTTFDSRELAKTGVVSYAPNYPQWVDPDSRSLRHVRVPLGASIAFDPTTQQFTIPAGTRFYRTLLQRVKEPDGSTKWRKIETQLIVAWPNTTNSKGNSVSTSLFGTYAWNEDESQAILVTDPYRDGSPFRDRIVTYVADEVQAAKTLSTNPPNKSYALHQDHAIRSFAIMGSRRCGQCHRGSPTRNFALGFTPLQIARRAKGEGGITEEAGADELSQLSRLIDYGLITGIATQDEVLPLEASQGTRLPRSEYELQAQAYVLGNCAHCHSPVGDATLEIPELQDGSLDFMPSATGGIFQFELEKFSKRILRAAGGPSPTVQMPYVTPSIMELGPSDPSWTGTGKYFNSKCTLQDNGAANVPYPMLAPWRSLVYRSVATPFTYSDDLALMLHMPQNTQSFDCDAPRIIGDWMVSIDSEVKPEGTSGYGVMVGTGNSYCFAPDSSPQPYYEVSKGKSRYKLAVADTADRMYRFHNTPVAPTNITPTIQNPYPDIPSYYDFCPDNFDIFDPYVIADPSKYSVPSDNNIIRDGHLVMPPDGVPNHAHWVVFDPTRIPGDWEPRRPDWYDVLVKDGKPPALESSSDSVAKVKWAGEALALQVLVGDRVGGTTDGIHLSGAVSALAATELPMGLWKVKAGCDFSRIRTVAHYKTAKQIPTWMQAQLDSGTLSGSEPVYSVTPGETIHNLICASCHGEKANSTGRHASVLSEITGGRATVTNLRDGLMNLANRQRVFGSAPTDHSSTSEDWAARYFNWMALGGTKQNIPRSILAMVANSTVVGKSRPLDTPPTDANMLSSARNRCASILPLTQQYLDSSSGNSEFQLLTRDMHGRYSFEAGMFESAGTKYTSLIYSNGDAALWERVCSVDNPTPIRAITVLVSTRTKVSLNTLLDLYPPELYPPNTPVVNHLGQVVTSSSSGGIQAENYFPWCIRAPTDSAKEAVDTWVAKNAADDGTRLPYCPELDRNGNPYIGKSYTANDPHLSGEDLQRWTLRGAANAGLVTYTYLSQLASEDIVPTPTYDQCENISN